MIPFPAGGVIGADGVAKAASVGYTLVLVGVFRSSMPVYTRKMPCDAVKDFTPVSEIGRSPAFLVAGPAGMPKPVVDRLAAAMDQVVRMPEVLGRLASMALNVAAPDADEMKRQLEADAARWVKLAQQLDIKPLD